MRPLSLRPDGLSCGARVNDRPRETAQTRARTDDETAVGDRLVQ